MVEKDCHIWDLNVTMYYGKCIFFYLAGEPIYFAAFSYIRNFYMGPTMDITRTVFTKPMFA